MVLAVARRSQDVDKPDIRDLLHHEGERLGEIIGLLVRNPLHAPREAFQRPSADRIHVADDDVRHDAPLLQRLQGSVAADDEIRAAQQIQGILLPGELPVADDGDCFHNN